MKVGIGSPFKGLQDVRRELHDSLAEEYQVLWMEDFGSQEVDALAASLRFVDESDVYLLIFGTSYGTQLPGSDYSYTHLEYEHAERTGTPVIAYVQRLNGDTTRDANAQDFLEQVRSGHLLEHDEFDSSAELLAFARRDLVRFRDRLARPKFSGAGAVADEESYALGALRQRVLDGAPFTVTLVDAGAVRDHTYRPEKRGRLGEKVESVRAVAKREGVSVQIFNDFPVIGRDDVIDHKAASVRANSRLIILLVGKAEAADVADLFQTRTGELAIFHADWFNAPSLAAAADYLRTYSDQDLRSCALRRAVLDLVEARLSRHVADEVS
jgi:hypothetical protein